MLIAAVLVCVASEHSRMDDVPDARNRFIWTAGGFLPPANGHASHVAMPPVSERPITVSGGSPLAARTKRAATLEDGDPTFDEGLHPPSSPPLPKLQTPAYGNRTSGSQSSRNSLLAGSYAGSHVGSYAPSAHPPGSISLSDGRSVRLLERRNHRLQIELQQTLNLYGQACNWLQSHKERQASIQADHQAELERVRAELVAAERRWRDALASAQAEGETKLAAASAQASSLEEENSRLSLLERAFDSQMATKLGEEREARKQAMLQRMARRFAMRGLLTGWNVR